MLSACKYRIMGLDDAHVLPDITPDMTLVSVLKADSPAIKFKDVTSGLTS